MPNLLQRVISGEEMDDLSLPKEKLIEVLVDLNKLNTLSCAAYFIAKTIKRIIPNTPNSFTLLDIGCGGGDILFKIVDCLRQSGLNVNAIGVDMNPLAIEYAKTKLSNSPIEFIVADAVTALRELKYDLVCSSLFLHHLEVDSIVEIFSLIKEKASIGFVMSDLERKRFVYFLTYAVTKIISRSTIIHEDGLKSVKAAFTKSEFVKLFQQVGFDNYQINQIFPCNLLMSWQKK